MSSTQVANKSVTTLRSCFQKYYQHLFPWKEFYNWFSYRDVANFVKREFAFTLSDRNYFLRGKSFETWEPLAHYVRCKVPIKIDIGAIFDSRPSNVKNDQSNEPMEKELVFDIDLSDYNDIRKCCSDTKVCQLCWKFAAVACKILDSILREDYGWKLILWVFSGRRGIHCWVCDESARKMTDKQRRQFISVLDIGTWLKMRKKAMPLNSKRLNNHIRRSYAIAKRSFLSTCVQEQDILGTDERVAIFLRLLPEICREELKRTFSLKVMSSEEKWIKFREYWTHEKNLKSFIWRQRRHLLKEIVLWYLYPRIDTNVTKAMNHLLKAPFSPHPETRNVCVPFDPRKVDEFNVEHVPRLHDFVDTAIVLKNNQNLVKSVDVLSQIMTWENSIRVFEDFVDQVQKASEQRPLVDVEA